MGKRIDVLAVMRDAVKQLESYDDYSGYEHTDALKKARDAVAELIEACRAYDKARENLLLSKRDIGTTYRKAAQLRDAVDRANLRRVTALARVGGA